MNRVFSDARRRGGATVLTALLVIGTLLGLLPPVPVAQAALPGTGGAQALTPALSQGERESAPVGLLPSAPAALPPQSGSVGAQSGVMAPPPPGGRPSAPNAVA